jgi:hypothetical protein
LVCHPNEYGQRIEEVSKSQNPQRVATAIAGRTDELVADKSVSAATLILPGITTMEGLSNVALALRDHPKWKVTTTKLPEPPTGNLVAVHIVREIPFGEEWCPSEVLVLGPFKVFPPTRRAPVTALEVFVGDPMPNDPKTHKPTTKANLAHMDLSDTDLTLNVIDRMWLRSEIGRRTSVGNVEDNRAKAKVSFVIPVSLARKLGCEP